MKTKAECLDKEGKVLNDTEYTEPNLHPEAEPPFSRIATVDRNSGIDVEDSTGRKQKSRVIGLFSEFSNSFLDWNAINRVGGGRYKKTGK